ncbi:MAG: tRNA (cytidine(34)-2'-O)-methyltransferase [Oligoflexia bacterium]|nr:tRNA (cytidine(34)-2'-O)-methyltransferase [Oligoflexia bacterium]
MQPNFNVVLVEPEIPNNTGSIGRTCVCTNSSLHLVGKLGFDISDAAVRRAGLDYWEKLNLKVHENFESLRQNIKNPSRVFYFSKKAEHSLYDVGFKLGDWFIFGKETKGLPPAILESVNSEQILKIPQWGPVRSLNLSNAVSIVLYEAARQTLVSSHSSQLAL